MKGKSHKSNPRSGENYTGRNTFERYERNNYSDEVMKRGRFNQYSGQNQRSSGNALPKSGKARPTGVNPPVNAKNTRKPPHSNSAVYGREYNARYNSRYVSGSSRGAAKKDYTISGGSIGVRPESGGKKTGHHKRNSQSYPSLGISAQGRYSTAGNSRMGNGQAALTKRGWFKIWMLMILCLAAAIVVIFSVSASRRSKDGVENRDHAGWAAALMSVPATDAETSEADTSDDGLFRASVTDVTADMGEDIESGYGVLIDISENTITASKGAFEKINPASMTKLMTLIVAYENIESLDGYFEMTSAIIDPVYTSDASLAGFAPGETVLIKDLFYGAALPSGAEATSALAICAAGDEKAFVRLMNQKVKELGLRNTHFENSSGLHDENHYSTCYDMAVILKCAMDNEFLRSVISTYQYTTAVTQKHPEGLLLENSMFSRMYGNEAPGFTVIGGKTGYTLEAEHCLASFGKVNATGKEYILVTAKGKERYTPVNDAITVYKKYASGFGGAEA